ncbi:MAG: hypothetical protein CVU55_13830 [Deltaproteobacteria bacterium HGW-Deltaproteobacteria-13]|nr:MAG: hypothetical protein CVU55_13830 [Deltaproteobacteria bacterium HGW-Deltaproteobacteria-13]
MRPGASLMERFNGWFVEPIEKLKELPEGDGGFLALSAALFLCERYYRAATDTLHMGRDNEKFKIEAAKDFGLSLDDFKCFWMVYRNGTQHQGIPQKYVDRHKMKYTWQICEDFDAIPEIYKINAYRREIRLNVWKFADFIIEKFRTNPEVFQKAISHTFPEVKDIGSDES